MNKPSNMKAARKMAEFPRAKETDFEECIQALPQELQDEILRYTLETETNTVVGINTIDHELGVVPVYKPPLGLHINRKYRTETAKKYYGTNTFHSQGANSLRLLLKSLPQAHIQLIQHVTVRHRISREWSPLQRELCCSACRDGLARDVRLRAFDPLRFSLEHVCARSGNSATTTMVKQGSMPIEWEMSSRVEESVDIQA